MSCMVELDNIDKVRMREDGTRMDVLRHVSLRFAAAGITVLIGPSGCGKTTLLRLVNRLEDPSAGRILVNGVDVAGLDPLQLRQTVVLVPQKPFMFVGSVLQNLQHPFVLRKQTPPSANDPLWIQSLAGVDLSDQLLSQQAASLSLGQQQRVGLARALLCDPEVVLLDEPTSALDRPASDRFATTLRTLCRQRQTSFVVVTHDLWFAERVADQVVFLSDGYVKELGSADQIFGAPQTEELRNFLMYPAAKGDGA